jgi:thiol-disulfide isomerase/thioredoxin
MQIDIAGMSEEVEEDDQTCDLDALKKYLKSEDKVIMYVSQEGCPACDAFERSALPEFLEKFPEDCGLAPIVLDPKDEKCIEVAKEFDVMATPTVYAVKKGKVVATLAPTGQKEKDVQALHELVEKLRK